MWTEQQVIDYFDKHWDVTIKDLARMSGWSEDTVKRILMGDDWAD